ncbi:putative MFS-type transporter YfkL [Oceanobacillus oncorhynchi subsp. incaldanensis]|uniref:Inner membrane transport protein YdiM n=1 Tax=Oceanobacillus oncorhynchi TaxID=545501 RepID=A0A0A1MCP2_9BACI|nr:MFS transporter [Oceanobacillus oncorhynchi]GIO17757.1 putative MFS-type transporter YfkL [Oceanobacillus oncorhynchi subsp. incaldanensis]CEI83140.1 Inner membrane transport protein YdiM [Oceanobacillus oncorhynchi]
MNNPYIKTSIGLYLNFFMLGMINIIIASNMGNLSRLYDVTPSQVSFLVSAIGIGKLAALFFVGRLSDKIGRKPIIIAASFLYLLFLLGMPLTSSYYLAFAFAITAGIANSLLDSGTYPALIESFPKKSSTATVLVKAFVSIGATVLPFLISFLAANGIFWGWSFFILGILYVISGVYLFFMPFPDVENGDASEDEESDKEQDKKVLKAKPSMMREGLAIILIGFTSTALFVVWQTWLPELGEQFIGLSEHDSVQLLSYFSVGALVSVILLAVVLDRFIKPITVLIVYPIIAFIAMLLLFFVESYPVVLVSTFLLGLFTSGLFQLALSIMTDFFRKNKGTTTAYVNIASSAAFILVPIITGSLVGYIGISMTLVFDMVIAVLGILLALYIASRRKKIFS